jgi:hypothetical protein
MHRYHGRANAIRPYNNLQIKNEDQNLPIKILINNKMPSTSFNHSRRGKFNSPFFNHYLFFYSISILPKDIHLKYVRKHIKHE